MALARSTSSSLLLLTALLSSWCGAIAARPAPSDAAAGGAVSSPFVRSWCAGTEYPSLCDATLAPYAGAVGASPARLAWAALTAAMGGARNATAAMRGMAAAMESGRGGPGPVAAAEAAQDCVSMLGDAVGMLRQSADAMARLGEEEDKGQQAAASGGGGGRDVRFQVDSVQTWASAALTDADMCIEGFRGEAAGGGGAREAVRGHVAGVQHLAANALCIVNSMAKQIP
ncbi:hypothetical protein ACP4OV_004134 [Aristida adscensionis]